nr:hypothetical protein Iba_chr11aCG9330 [Ipomoea batatas]
MVSKSSSLIFSLLLICAFLCFSTTYATSRRLYAAVEGGYSGVPMSIPEAGSLHVKDARDCMNLQDGTFACNIHRGENNVAVHIAVELEAEEKNTYIYFPSADDADSITERLIRTKLDKIACVASF